MTILALEFSSARRSVALSRAGQLLAEAVQHTESRATNALGLVEKVLANAKLSRTEIEGLAVGLGPGSYTGIRTAIALAQGWQLAREIKLTGVSSIAAMIAQARAEKIFGRVNVLVDAQRGEFYLATWDLSKSSQQEIAPLKIVPVSEVERRQAAGEICVGPEQTRRLFPGAAEIANLTDPISARTIGKNEFLEPIYLRPTSYAKAPPLRET